MKKFIIVVSVLVFLLLTADYLYYYEGVYIDFHPDEEVTSFTKTTETDILLNTGNGFVPFEIKGVNLGTGQPGEWSTDFAITEETYLRWFQMIQDMGANTIRVYSVQSDAFYNAFYKYNKNNPQPLWLLHGIWVNDYIQNSFRDAYHEEFYDHFIEDCRTAVDVIHGNKKIQLGRRASSGSGIYTKDISPWVIGYIAGVEWDGDTVAFTDEQRSDLVSVPFKGEYLYTDQEATPFETMLARVGDDMISYESSRYKTQRLLAFSNWPFTDPFKYPESVTQFFKKCAAVDVEHIKETDKFTAGQFASYHVYPYYPDYLNYMNDDEMQQYLKIGGRENYPAENGNMNTYRAYISLLNEHHSMPVVISEFGISTGRGMANTDRNTGRNQGNMSEQEQGQALADCYQDIMSADSAGCCIASWQDEWFKRTWNTMYAVDLTRTPYWSDYQTNGQFFGILTFDPGKEKSVCYVDGDISEWTEEDLVTNNSDGELWVKYDEKFMYFLMHVPNLNFESDSVYIPLDVTPKSGSYYCENYGLRFARYADFVIALHGQNDSRIMVHERYEALRSTYAEDVYLFDTYLKYHIPDKDSSKFVPINMILRMHSKLQEQYWKDQMEDISFETGKLTYGNANPENSDFNSLADFICKGDYIELRIPWQLLNFGDPTHMRIHDDYYDGNYGVKLISIEKIYAGLAVNNPRRRIWFEEVPLKGWQNRVTYHERLKQSYGMIQELWREDQ